MTKRHEYYHDSDGKLKERAQGKPKRLPPHIIRNINMALTGPGFVCPVCRKRFKLDYGTMGKMAWRDQAQFHCKDCAKRVSFMKVG